MYQLDYSLHELVVNLSHKPGSRKKIFPSPIDSRYQTVSFCRAMITCFIHKFVFSNFQHATLSSLRNVFSISVITLLLQSNAYRHYAYTSCKRSSKPLYLLRRWRTNHELLARSLGPTTLTLILFSRSGYVRGLRDMRSQVGTLSIKHCPFGKK